MPSGYDWYWNAGAGGAAAIDYGTVIAVTAAGNAAPTLAALGMAEDTDYWFACKARTSAGVRSAASTPFRVRIHDGELLSEPPSAMQFAALRAAAGGVVYIDFRYSRAGERGVAATAQIAPVSGGVANWGALLATVAITAVGVQAVNVGTYGDGVSVQAAVRAVTADGVVGAELQTAAILADATPPPAAANVSATAI